MTKTDALSVTMDGDRELAMTRAFAAPRDLVFEAFTTPALVSRWLLGPDGWSMPVCEIDPTPGGAYRYRWRNDSDGKEFGVSGTFIEITPGERIVHTELFDDDWTGGQAVVTTTFSEEAGQTTVRMTVLYASTEARQGVMKTGMTKGVAASFDRLESILATEGA